MHVFTQAIFILNENVPVFESIHVQHKIYLKT